MRRVLVLRGVGCLTGLILVVAGLAAVPMNLDPTDDANFASVTFVNNTKSQAELLTCSGDGSDCHSLGNLMPGDTQEQSVAFGDFTSAFQVHPRGSQPAWLVISLPEHTEGSVFWIGDATSSLYVLSPDHGRPRIKAS